MNITILKSKIHKASVTHCNLNYEGSISIDSQFMKKTGIIPYEKVLVANISRGTRWETYAISAKPNSGIIRLNGAAARLGKIGDRITIMAFTSVPLTSTRRFKPKIIVLGGRNKIRRAL